MIKIYRTIEFIEWFSLESEKSKVQIDARLSKIQDEDYTRDLLICQINHSLIEQKLTERFGRVRHLKIPTQSEHCVTYYGFLTLELFENHREFTKIVKKFKFKYGDIENDINVALSETYPRRSDKFFGELEMEYEERQRRTVKRNRETSDSENSDDYYDDYPPNKQPKVIDVEEQRLETLIKIQKLIEREIISEREFKTREDEINKSEVEAKIKIQTAESKQQEKEIELERKEKALEEKEIDLIIRETAVIEKEKKQRWQRR